MKRVIVIAFTCCILFAQVSNAASICTSYQNLSSEDRQNIADTRFDLESIEQNISDVEYGARFNQIINSHAEKFNKVLLHNYLQGLIAEALFRRYIYQSIGLENMAYRRFQIFADLILYHKAMDHKGFVKPEVFVKAKANLETEINNYYQQKQAEFIAQIRTIKSSNADQLAIEQADTTISKAKALAFLELENKRMQMLGSIEIMWSQLLERNQFNQTEVLADLAIAEISINAATAVVGFSALVGYGPAFLKTASALHALPLSIAVGCGFGASNRYFSEGMTASYLEMSRALYQSVQNHTSFACELGQKINSDGSKNMIQIPDAVPAANSTDYLIACAAVGTSMVFPKMAGFAFGGVLLGSLAVSSHHLVMESLVVLEEIPRLYQLKEQLKNLQSPEEIALLEKQINDSHAKITLYLLAFGNSSIEAFRLGIFLYGGRSQVQDTVNKAKVFLASRQQLNDRADLQLMNLILGGMTPHLH